MDLEIPRWRAWVTFISPSVVKGRSTFPKNPIHRKKLGVPCIELTGLEVEDRGSQYVAGQKAGVLRIQPQVRSLAFCWPAQWELQSVLWPVLIAEARLGIRKAAIRGG